jgi:hypothetical protein
MAIGSLAAFGLAAIGNAATVKSVDVEVELSAIENPRAAEYWTTIADDLENAIVARIADQVSDDGVDLKIDLEEVSLSNGFEDTLGLEDTRLIGDVTMTHASDNSRFGTYQLTVDVNTALPMIPADVDVTILPADSRVYYEAMIATFAQGVVDRLK